MTALAIARATAGGRGFAELTARLADALREAAQTREPALRLWLIREDQAEETAQDPVEAAFPEQDHAS